MRDNTEYQIGVIPTNVQKTALGTNTWYWYIQGTLVVYGSNNQDSCYGKGELEKNRCYIEHNGYTPDGRGSVSTFWSADGTLATEGVETITSTVTYIYCWPSLQCFTNTLTFYTNFFRTLALTSTTGDPTCDNPWYDWRMGLAASGYFCEQRRDANGQPQIVTWYQIGSDCRPNETNYNVPLYRTGADIVMWETDTNINHGLRFDITNNVGFWQPVYSTRATSSPDDLVYDGFLSNTMPTNQMTGFQFHGWGIDGARILYKLDTTNGFKYR